MSLLVALARDPPGLLAALAVLWAAGYLAACAYWPFTPCRRCQGTARLPSPSGRAWRRCPRCRGTGHRIRTGRQVLDWIRTRHH